MRRFAEEKPLMERRVRHDRAKHRAFQQKCDCSAGKFRKKRVFGCARGKSRCSCCWAAGMDRMVLSNFKAERRNLPA